MISQILGSCPFLKRPRRSYISLQRKTSQSGAAAKINKWIKFSDFTSLRRQSSGLLVNKVSNTNRIGSRTSSKITGNDGLVEYMWLPFSVISYVDKFASCALVWAFVTGKKVCFLRSTPWAQRQCSTAITFCSLDRLPCRIWSLWVKQYYMSVLSGP